MRGRRRLVPLHRPVTTDTKTLYLVQLVAILLFVGTWQPGNGKVCSVTCHVKVS